MKQLLHTFDSHIVAGLNDRAYALRDASVCELLAPTSADKTNVSKDDSLLSKQNATEPQDKKETTPNANEIQAVATICYGAEVWCAVSRYDKTLSLYRLDGIKPTTTREPTTVHRSAKRVSCLAFASIPSGTNGPSLNVIIAGDLIGDATAFPLRKTTSESVSRVLLGHTASMLTGVQVVNDDKRQRILTSDRDEKIRISGFPDTVVIEGYLLGHTAFVAAMDVASKSGCTKCITCGGDDTVRLWDYQQCKELAVVNTKPGTCENELLPTRVGISPDGTTAAVTYDSSNKIDILSTKADKLEVYQSIVCATQPLSIRFPSNERILVLARDPAYMVEFTMDKDTRQFSLTSSESAQALQQVAAKVGVIMPTTIMETDEKSGQLKMQKLKETRGWTGEEKPWHRVERIQKSKEASSRRKRRKRDTHESGGDGSDEE